MKILGHRGDGVSNKTPELRTLRKSQNKLPENTLASFKKVLDAGADGIEFDIIISADGHAMVIHDDDLSLHAADDTVGLVSEKTHEELKEVDVGDGQSIPALEEIIELAGKNKILNIELKSNDSAEIVVKIAQEYIAKGWDRDNFLISSFNNELLKTIKNIEPDLRVGVFFGKDKSLDDIPAIIEEYQPFSIHPDVNDISEQRLRIAKENGITVVGWTSGARADDRGWFAKLENLSDKGYNNIWLITDFPEL
jgi:glycerophosphoryl diester phosphodiesterase